MTVDTRRRTGSVTSVVLAVVLRERIITLAPARSQQSYRHEAFLWHDASDFTAGIVPFITDGLEAGEPVMVAVGALHTRWLRGSKGRRRWSSSTWRRLAGIQHRSFPLGSSS